MAAISDTTKDAVWTAQGWLRRLLWGAFKH